MAANAADMLRKLAATCEASAEALQALDIGPAHDPREPGNSPSNQANRARHVLRKRLCRGLVQTAGQAAAMAERVPSDAAFPGAGPAAESDKSSKSAAKK